MIKTAFISDTHGNWDIMEHTLDCIIRDGVKLIVHSGDICPHFDQRPGTALDRIGQQEWFKESYVRYFHEHPDIDFVMIAGNHDFCFVKPPFYTQKFNWYWKFDGKDDWLPWEQIGFVPPEISKYLPKNLHILNCESKVIQGIKFFGVPHSKIFYNWCFNVSTEMSKELWNMVPTDTQILISHGPPHGIGDYIKKRDEHVGCEHLTARVPDLTSLKYICCGHIHPGYGIYEIGNTKVINAALSNDNNHIKSKPIVIDIEN